MIKKPTRNMHVSTGGEQKKHSQCQETPDGSTVGRNCTEAKIPREQQKERESEKEKER